MLTNATSEEDSNSKAQAIMVEEAEDRISALLPTIDAVRTTVLSTRWKDQWTSVHILEFSDEHFHDHPERFLSFVNRVLLFRDSSSEIRKFCISGTGDLYHIIGQTTASYLLICSYPVLEELTIYGLLGSLISPCHHVEVFAPELKTLILRCKGFAMFHAMLNLCIDAPKLENLHIEEPLLPILFLMNAKSFPCHYYLTKPGTV